MTVDTFKILCVIKHEHKEAMATAKKVSSWLNERKVESILISSHAPKEEIISAAKDCHLALIIGGDGTTLAVARALHDNQLPIIGINYGKVGFLTEINPNKWQEFMPKILKALDKIYNNKENIDEECLFIDEHSLLVCTVERNNKEIYKGFAMNDAVIARSNIARALSLSLCIDNTPLSNLRCDGLIVSTPIGATAYAIAAHGPLALPSLDAQIITPICPFAGAFPPCVASGNAKISIEITDESIKSILTLDGQENFPLEEKDIVNITSYKYKVPLLVSDKGWYIKRLISRGYIHEGPGTRAIDNEIRG